MVQFDRYGFLITRKNREMAAQLEDQHLVTKENERLVKWKYMLDHFGDFTTKRRKKVCDFGGQVI